MTELLNITSMNTLKEPKIAKKMYNTKNREEMYQIVEDALKKDSEKELKKINSKKKIISKIKEAVANA